LSPSFAANNFSDADFVDVAASLWMHIASDDCFLSASTQPGCRKGYRKQKDLVTVLGAPKKQIP